MNILIFNETSSTHWFDVLNAVITIMLSIAIAVFTYQQVKIAKMKRKDDLYYQRYKVYDKFWEFAKSVTDERGNINKQKNLLREAMSHEFLFNDDIKNFMKETWKRHHLDIASIFVCHYAHIAEGSVIYSSSCPKDKENKYKETYYYFMDNFLKDLRDKFEPYLKLEK